MTLFDVKLSIKSFTTFNFFVYPVYAKMKNMLVLREAFQKQNFFVTNVKPPFVTKKTRVFFSPSQKKKIGRPHTYWLHIRLE